MSNNTPKTPTADSGSVEHLANRDGWMAERDAILRERNELKAEVERLRDLHAFDLKELERGNDIIDLLRIERDRLRAENAEQRELLERAEYLGAWTLSQMHRWDNDRRSVLTRGGME